MSILRSAADLEIADRPYIKIHPTESRLSPQTVRSHFERLYQLESNTKQPWYKRFFPTATTTPTIEWLLVTDGQPTTTLDYYVGIDDPDLIDGLNDLCRGLFPNGYQIERTDWHPARVLLSNSVQSNPMIASLLPESISLMTLTPVSESHSAVRLTVDGTGRRD